jgi:hypothetical protein
LVIGYWLLVIRRLNQMPDSQTTSGYLTKKVALQTCHEIGRRLARLLVGGKDIGELGIRVNRVRFHCHFDNPANSGKRNFMI